jgi:chorismate dehydratase
LDGLDELFASARDRGVRRIAEIARRESAGIGISEAEALAYLKGHLIFWLGEQERSGLERFARLAAQNGLAPSGVERVVAHRPAS